MFVTIPVARLLRAEWRDFPVLLGPGDAPMEAGLTRPVGFSGVSMVSIFARAL